MHRSVILHVETSEDTEVIVTDNSATSPGVDIRLGGWGGVAVHVPKTLFAEFAKNLHAALNETHALLNPAPEPAAPCECAVAKQTPLTGTATKQRQRPKRR